MNLEQRAEAAIERVRAELPTNWLGGRQRMVLAKSLAMELKAVVEACALKAEEFKDYAVREDLSGGYTACVIAQQIRKEVGR